jgi:sterol desaturase/sphingolipid hydroxylase (fatty acid hydroxylase superfamily)
MLILALAFALGGLGWSLTEYFLHRFGAHEGPNKLEFRKEHLAHHARANYFAPTSKKIVGAGKVVVPMGVVAALIAGWAGVAFALGFTAMYTGYEVLHRRIHTHPPTGPYSRLVRKHHYVHHFMDAKSNHGVTSPIWDIVFGTRRVVTGPVRVPAKLAPLWLFDAGGHVRPAFSCDYERRGRSVRLHPPAASTPPPAVAEAVPVPVPPPADEARV